MSDHEARARGICAPEYFGGVRSNDEQHIRDVAEALRTVRRETLEEAARVALTCDGDFERDTDARTVEATRRGVAAAICSLAVKEGEGV